VQGNGQTALVEAFTGLRAALRARIILSPARTSPTPACATRHAWAWPISRRTASGWDHPDTSPSPKTWCSTPITIAAFLFAGLQIDWPKVSRNAAENAVEFDVRTPSVFLQPDTCRAATSRRWWWRASLSRDTKLLIAAQPTRGLDVGSIEYIHSA
jgi:ABC-type uncharacterized transport system ATPase subunit